MPRCEAPRPEDGTKLNPNASLASTPESPVPTPSTFLAHPELIAVEDVPMRRRRNRRRDARRAHQADGARPRDHRARRRYAETGRRIDVQVRRELRRAARRHRRARHSVAARHADASGKNISRSTLTRRRRARSRFAYGRRAPNCSSARKITAARRPPCSRAYGAETWKGGAQ